MRITYEENPNPTLIIVAPATSLRVKTIGVASYDVGNIIADALARWDIQASDLMYPEIVSGADVLKLLTERQ